MPSSAMTSPSTLPPAAAGVQGRLLLLLALLTAFGPLAIDMYLPALPAIAAELHTSSGAVQATLAAYLAGHGRRPALLRHAGGPLRAAAAVAHRPGTVTVASLGCAQAQSVTAWRLVQTLGGCVGVVMPLTIVADRVRGAIDTARVMSQLTAVLGLAPIAAPTLGGAVQALAGWRGIFAVLAVLGGVAGLLV